MRYLIYSTLEDAQSSISQINKNSILIFENRGYTVINGEVFGKRLSSGEVNLKAQPTTSWAVPEQRSDGKWIVRHPEEFPGANVIIDDNETTAANAVMVGVAYDNIEIYSPLWFPTADL